MLAEMVILHLMDDFDFNFEEMKASLMGMNDLYSVVRPVVFAICQGFFQMQCSSLQSVYDGAHSTACAIFYCHCRFVWFFLHQNLRISGKTCLNCLL